jgi:glutamate-ammonia-ligase adenylyltransferase
MQLPQVRELLERPELAAATLAPWGLHDVPRAHRNLTAMAEAGVTLDLMASICRQLAAELPRLSDADMALNNLERFVVSQRSPLSLATLFERDPEALPVLLQIFSTSQYSATARATTFCG